MGWCKEMPACPRLESRRAPKSPALGRQQWFGCRYGHKAQGAQGGRARRFPSCAAGARAAQCVGADRKKALSEKKMKQKKCKTLLNITLLCVTCTFLQKLFFGSLKFGCFAQAHKMQVKKPQEKNLRSQSARASDSAAYAVKFTVSKHSLAGKTKTAAALQQRAQCSTRTCAGLLAHVHICFSPRAGHQSLRH
jgi:hypothetical protein